MQVCVNSIYSEKLNIKYRVPQGSCSGANNFVAYCAPIEDVLKDTAVDLSGYADDHSIRKAFKPAKPSAESEAMLILKNAVADIDTWMGQMRLKLNQDKTELIMFGYKKQLNKCKIQLINLDGNLIELSTNVKYLGGSLDANLNFKKHVGIACGKAKANFYKIRSIW